MENKKLPTKMIISLLIVVIIGLLIYSVINNFGAINEKVNLIFRIVSPFLIGIVISFILNPLFTKIKTSLFKNSNHTTAISLLLTYLIVFTVIAAISYFAVPELVSSVVTLVDKAPDYIKQIDEYIIEFTNFLGLDLEDSNLIYNYWTSLSNELINNMNSLLPKVLEFSKGVVNITINSLIALITSVYLLLDKENFLHGAKKLIIALTKEEHTDKILRVLTDANKIFKGFLTGKIIDSIIIGIICFIFMSIVKLPYAALVSTIIGVTNVIPVFGPFIGAIPGAIIMLSISPMTCLVFVIWIIVLQQFDGNILGPKILGDYTGISAIWILVVVTIGGGLFGFVGMLFAVPVFAVFYKFFGEYIDYRMAKKQSAKPIEESVE